MDKICLHQEYNIKIKSNVEFIKFKLMLNIVNNNYKKVVDYIKIQR